MNPRMRTEAVMVLTTVPHPGVSLPGAATTR